MGLAQLLGAPPIRNYSASLKPAMSGTFTTGAENPYAPRTGLLGDMLGDTKNPFLRALASPGVGDMLQDLGFGLMQGTDFSEGLAKAAEHTAEMRPYRDERQMLSQQWQQGERTKSRMYDSIAKMGPEFAPLAEALQSGAIDPNSAFSQAFKLKSDLASRADTDTRNRANAGFLKDPQLQQLVASGAMPFKDAYAIQTGGGTGGGGFGDTIVPGLDADGNLVPMRASPDGGLSLAKMPDGVRYAPDALAGARAGGGIDGKTRANAQAALPGAEQAVQLSLKAIDNLRQNTRGLEEQFGGINRTFGATPGTPMGNFQVDLEQAGGQAFLQARQFLKGQGQITDFESRRAEAAFSRIQTAAEKGDQATFLAALDDFEQAVTDGYDKLQAVASGSYSPGNYGGGGGGGGGLGGGGADPLNLFGGQ